MIEYSTELFQGTQLLFANAITMGRQTTDKITPYKPANACDNKNYRQTEKRFQLKVI